MRALRKGRTALSRSATKLRDRARRGPPPRGLAGVSTLSIGDASRSVLTWLVFGFMSLVSAWNGNPELNWVTGLYMIIRSRCAKVANRYSSPSIVFARTLLGSCTAMDRQSGPDKSQNRPKKRNLR